MKTNKMIIIVLSISIMLFASCNDNDKPNGANEPLADELSVSPVEFEFAANDKNVKTVTVETNAKNWNITQSNDWITVEKGDNTFTVTVKENKATSVRTGTLTVKAGKATPVVISVKQLAGSEVQVKLEVSPIELEFAGDDTGKQLVEVTTNLESWNANLSENNEWIIIEKLSNGFYVSVLENTQASGRAGTITVTSGDAKPVIVTVTQLAGEGGEPVLWANDPNLQVLRAFPCAEGFGANVTGGRGGTVLYVTNLDDNGTGSLRHAVTRSDITGPRIIMFKIAGEIKLSSQLTINRSNITIAGHSAPGDGICISGNTVYVGANNVIIRYMRFRMGDLNDIQNDAIWGRNQQNIIIDHCSMSWSTDECASFYDNDNFTLQWCILSESLRVSVHEKGNHGYLGIWGGRNASFHHNLLAHHDSRNPRFNGSRYSNRANDELVDFRNNVIYNWGGNSGYAGEGGRYNMVNNYYKPGPGSANSARIFQPNADDGSNSQQAGVWGMFYVAGNYMTLQNGNPNTTVINDNWSAIHPNPNTKNKAELKSNVEYPKGDIVTHTAQEAYELVLNSAGASFCRDKTDARVVNEVRNHLAPVRASGNGGTRAGMVDSQKDVGGWEVYTYNPIDVTTDTDNDGIPDDWEIENGLNPNNIADGNATNLSGGTYTNLEVYLYSLEKKK